MATVQSLILDFEGEQKAVLQYLHELMISFPEVQARITYKIPFYYRKSWICYLNPAKDGSVEFAFTRGNELGNRLGLLQPNGRKQVRGIVFEKFSDIPVEALMEIIQEALLLDEAVPYTVRKKE